MDKIKIAVLLTATIGAAPAHAAQTWNYTYNSLGLIDSADGPRVDATDVTSYTYNAAGQLVSVANALGHITQFQNYNSRGLPQTVIDPNGVEIHLTYHLKGWLASITVKSPVGSLELDATTTYTYDALGQLVQLVRPSGEILNYQYDEARRLVAISNSLGETIEYTLDVAGNRTAEVVKSETGEIKRSTTKSYDELSRLKSIVGATRQIASYVYDPDGNRIEDVDGRSYTKEQSYDSLNRPAVTTDANLNTSSVLYDELDRITQVVDQRGVTTNYTYDVFDNVLVQTSPDTGTTSYTYDEAGNRLTATDARGIVTNYTYDALNRVTQVDYNGSPGDMVQYGYDSTVDGNYGTGRLTSIDDASGFTYYHYNHQGSIGVVRYFDVVLFTKLLIT